MRTLCFVVLKRALIAIQCELSLTVPRKKCPKKLKKIYLISLFIDIKKVLKTDINEKNVRTRINLKQAVLTIHTNHII